MSCLTLSILSKNSTLFIKAFIDKNVNFFLKITSNISKDVRIEKYENYAKIY